MKKAALLSILSLFLLACTSEESQMKDTAMEKAHEQFLTQMHLKVEEKFTDKRLLKENFAKKVLGRSEFLIDKVERTGDSAKVTIKIETIPPKVRDAMIDIMAKVDPGRENNFNVPDAIKMVYQQLGLKPEATSQEIVTIPMRKDHVWKVAP